MAEMTVGPFITVAAFCEKVLDEQGTVSLIRLADRIVVHHVSPPQIFDANHKPLEPSANLAFYIRITAYNCSTTHELRLTMKNPLGEEKEITKHSLTFEPGRQGANFRGDLTLNVKHPGFYWMRLFLDEKLANEIPLEIVVSGTSVGG